MVKASQLLGSWARIGTLVPGFQSKDIPILLSCQLIKSTGLCVQGSNSDKQKSQLQTDVVISNLNG
jgi:hypothetical protein